MSTMEARLETREDLGNWDIVEMWGGGNGVKRVSLEGLHSDSLQLGALWLHDEAGLSFVEWFSDWRLATPSELLDVMDFFLSHQQPQNIKYNFVSWRITLCLSFSWFHRYDLSSKSYP